jgi:hypothetical protein
MEQRIKDLCSQLVSTRDPDEVQFIGEQLRSAIHEHVESLRHEVTGFPVLEAVLLAS